MRSSYVPIGLFVIVAIRFAVSPCLFSRLVHAEKPNPVELEPYECGIETLGDARDRRTIN